MPSSAPPVREILLVAGEASGDLHAGILAEALRRRRPDLALVGTGGPRMAAAGVEMLEQIEGVVGFVEVLRHVPAHLRLLRRRTARLRSGRVGLVILIDYPGFNLRVAAAARAAGVPVLDYITPQVWAWKRGRVRTMAEVITKAAVPRLDRSTRLKLDFSAVVSTVTKADLLAGWKATISATRRVLASPV